GYALTDEEILDVGAQGIDFADNVVAGSERKRRRFRVEAVAREDVGIGDSGGEVSDKDLAGAGRGEIVLEAFEDMTYAVRSVHHAKILLSIHDYESNPALRNVC